MEEILIVDGYNIIGDWPELQQIKMQESLEEARIRLLDDLSDYQSYTGKKVIVVFDAYQVQGMEKNYKYKRLHIFYTAENETADERIERLVKKLKTRRNHIQVATSDRTEQWVVFAMGALRLSARELAIEIEKSQTKIAERVKQSPMSPKIKLEDKLNDEIIKKFEQWRRK